MLLVQHDESVSLLGFPADYHQSYDLWPGHADSLPARPEHMRELYRICRAERKIWKPLPNGTHNESVLQPMYFEYITDFINQEVLLSKAGME